MVEKYYKNDLDFILYLKDKEGNYLGFPNYDFTASFYTASKMNNFVAKKVGDELTNCFNDNGKLHIVMNNHGLSAGLLKVDFTFNIPDDIYPDGGKRVVVPKDLCINLVKSLKDPCSMAVEIPSEGSRYNEPLQLSEFLHRGVIKSTSKAGDVYINNGIVRLCTKGLGIGEQRRYDIGRLFEKYIDIGQFTFNFIYNECFFDVLYDEKEKVAYVTRKDKEVGMQESGVRVDYYAGYAIAPFAFINRRGQLTLFHEYNGNYRRIAPPNIDGNKFAILTQTLEKGPVIRLDGHPYYIQVQSRVCQVSQGVRRPEGSDRFSKERRAWRNLSSLANRRLYRIRYVRKRRSGGYIGMSDWAYYTITGMIEEKYYVGEKIVGKRLA